MSITTSLPSVGDGKAPFFSYETTSLCGTCKVALLAKVVEHDGEVWMEKMCKMHGSQRVKLSTDAAWYADTRATKHEYAPPTVFPKSIERGCPFDCGACSAHVAKTRLPVVTITSACNLDCPICYVHNKNDGAYEMSLEDFRRTISALKKEHTDLDIVNLTGGEPTLHPRLLEMLDIAKEEGVHRVTVCSNGIRLVKDRAFAEALASRGARVALSFDTFDEHADVAMQGAKMLDVKRRTIEICDELSLDVTLIPVVTRGYNHEELGKIVDFAMQHACIRHVEFHTMTYTGQSGASFDRSGRISMVEVLDEIATQTRGLLTRADFVTSPCAHPLCYQIAYLLVDDEGGPPIPYTRFMSREDLRACLGERLYLEPSARVEVVMRRAVMDLFARDDSHDEHAHRETQRTLRLLKTQIKALFSGDRDVDGNLEPRSRESALRAAELSTKAIYIHSHMDEETFDTERLAACSDANCYADGTQIPVCAYNVLYREKESAFMLTPREWTSRDGGRFGVAEAARNPKRLPLLATR